MSIGKRGARRDDRTRFIATNTYYSDSSGFSPALTLSSTAASADKDGIIATIVPIDAARVGGR